MTDAVEFMKRILAEGQPGAITSEAAQGVHWHEAAAAMRQVVNTGSPGADDVIRSVLKFDGTIKLNPSSELPHAMSPEDMLRSITIQGLDDEGVAKHRRELEQLAETSDTLALRRLAQLRLRVPQ